jgi:formyltetrahydrofolate deformylase
MHLCRSWLELPPLQFWSFPMRTFRLVIACPDRVGIVAKVSNFLATYNGWITEASHHSDHQSGWFFMRHEIRADSLPFDLAGFRQAFGPIAREFSMEWRISDSAEKRRVVLMASRESHCLADLLHRWRSDELDCEIPCVISNHNDLRSMVEWHGIPFHHVPVDPTNKQPAFEQVSQLIDEYSADTVVLARYMQILPPDLCERYRHQVINIHHSFLPSFVGAKPYHQASLRGVKLIGATCHYVTEELDAGPIIEQDVVRVTHRDSIETMVRLGKDVEKLVLARGLRYHLEDRVLVRDNKTVVFD